MVSRDQRLAQTKYAGKQSASATAAAKSKPTKVAEDPMDAMRRALAQPRTQESVDRAHAHQRSLPPLGRPVN